MSRVAKKINCSNLEIIELECLQNEADNPQLQKRAAMILMCHAGTPVKEIADTLNDYPNNVIKWRNRYLESGIDGLKNRNGANSAARNRVLTEEIRRLLMQDPPDGYERWDAALLAGELGLSRDHVWRLLRASGVQLERKRVWSVHLHEPNQRQNITVIGLFLGNKEKAIVFRLNSKNDSLLKPELYLQTRQRKLYDHLTQTSSNTELTLLSALQVSAEFIEGSEHLNRKEAFLSEYIDTLIKNDYLDDGEDSHILFFSDDTCASFARYIRNSNTVLHETKTYDEWKTKATFFFELFYDSDHTSSPRQMMYAIDAFGNVASDRTDPFICQVELRSAPA